MARGVQTDMVDGLASSTAVKGPCYLATTANVTLAGLQTIDGTVLTDGKRVLVRANTDATENGIYVVSTGNWRRARDFSRNDDVKEGTSVRVTDGATGAGVWVCTTADPIVFDTSDIVFARDNTLTDGALLAINNLGDLDSAIAGWDALARYTGSVAAVAGVLDLSAATAPLLALGAGAITSVTLAAQKLRLARTTAAILLTPSATLVVNGGISTTRGFNIPIGSLVMFIGDTGGVVRVFVLALGSWSKGVAIASAATVTLTPNATHHITGVTTITDIDFLPAEDGAIAWVIFDGALTLTNSASLLLPGGASITTAANDRALFMQDSGDNVICLAYERASASPMPSGLVQGDILYVSAAGVISRLPKGTAAQLLAMNAGATAPEWVAAPSSGGMTLLGTVATTSGGSASLTGIPAGYRALFIELDGVSVATSGNNLQLALSSTNGAAYGTAVNVSGSNANAADVWSGSLWVENISSAIAAAKITRPAIMLNGGAPFATAGAAPTNTAAVVDAVRLSATGSTFDAGSIRIWGVK